MKTAAIIVAAGRGTRAGGPVPKQWQMLAGRRVADWTVAGFQTHSRIDTIVFVHHPDDTDLPAGVIVTPGGATRSESVLAGLNALQSINPDYVLIHDVARPCVSHDLITCCIDALKTHTAAAPALPVTDALWNGAKNMVTGLQSRENLYRAQTPQAFHYPSILKAHAQSAGNATDDVEIALQAGLNVQILIGEETNLKITHAADFRRAEQILRGQMDIRVGNGFDVHKFGDGDHVILCGVRIPHSHALMGHSDADVAMHAVTDAIYGALADGDIGQHFPPSDPQWKGADSAVFLRHAVDLATQRGYKISNMDCTLICEHPKIGPHSGAMRARMAELMGLDQTRISVKATTSETLGFTGRGEGIAAMATVTLVMS